jgi:two-component system nitrogen regulation response regulator GlnG
MRANVRVVAATHQDLDERVRQGLFREDLFHRLNVIRLRLPPLRERREDIALLARHFLQKSARELGGEPKRLSARALCVLQAFSWPGNVRQLENTCRWLMVMAPAQLIDARDLPPEIREAAGAGTESATSAAAGAGADTAPDARPGTPAGHGDASGVPEQVLRRGVGTQGTPRWSQLLGREVAVQLAAQAGAAHGALMHRLTREFEATVLRVALQHTRGRRIDAALRLGIGRNTITRKIQELGLDAGADADGDGAGGSRNERP